ncbi:hypothetical protein PX699_27055 [Sphingobium sp. H39-3-25]|uniref:hypothetical protein n=1 Tax=Sphingobium arseniciresistens TaxID=3030834 RepID=UPI0023B949C6|nr:hypothetical protein [Sphingobium arseniciresistens]
MPHLLKMVSHAHESVSSKLQYGADGARPWHRSFSLMLPAEDNAALEKWPAQAALDADAAPKAVIQTLLAAHPSLLRPYKETYDFEANGSSWS